MMRARAIVILLGLAPAGCTCADGKCGDGVREAPEACDGTDLDGDSCAARGYIGGSLACRADCTLDTSPCASCGDGTATGTEPCDGADVRGQSCASLGYDGGQLACAGCALDSTGCFTCGDGQRAPDELCDGADLGGRDCRSEGFQGGTLGCSAVCQLDDTACVPFEYNAYALRFDGSDNVVDCGEMSASIGLPLSTFTLELWMKPDIGAEGSVFQKWSWTSPPAPAFLVMFHNPSGFAQCTQGTPCCSIFLGEGAGGFIGYDGQPVPALEWHHVAITYEPGPTGLQELTLVIDGVVVVVTPDGGPGLFVPASALSVLMGLGEAPDGSGDPWAYEGLVDEIRLWNMARTPSEIAADRFSSLSGTEPGLVAYWPFDEGSGQFTVDVVSGTTCRFGTTVGVDADDAAWSTDTPF
jgi:hypothetical protein